MSLLSAAFLATAMNGTDIEASNPKEEALPRETEGYIASTLDIAEGGMLESIEFCKKRTSEIIYTLNKNGEITGPFGNEYQGDEKCEVIQPSGNESLLRGILEDIADDLKSRLIDRTTYDIVVKNNRKYIVGYEGHYSYETIFERYNQIFITLLSGILLIFIIPVAFGKRYKLPKIVSSRELNRQLQMTANNRLIIQEDIKRKKEAEVLQTKVKWARVGRTATDEDIRKSKIRTHWKKIDHKKRNEEERQQEEAKDMRQQSKKLEKCSTYNL